MCREDSSLDELKYRLLKSLVVERWYNVSISFLAAGCNDGSLRIWGLVIMESIVLVCRGERAMIVHYGWRFRIK